MALNAIMGDVAQNSYVTEDEATEYFEDRAYTAPWTAFVDKEPLLVLCSRTLDWYINWKGFKSDPNQPMQWFRKGVVLKDGSVISETVLPQEVKIAVFELVLSSLVEDRTDDDPLIGLEQLKIASLSIRTKPDKYGRKSETKKVIPEKVLKILSDLRGGSSVGVVRLMRG